MTYDWSDSAGVPPNTLEWFEDQDRRSAAAHRHFATDVVPFDRLIPYNSLRGKEVLEVGIGSGFHSELLARAGAKVTGIDLTDAAVEHTRRRFELKGLSGDFQTWDAEQNRADFVQRFSFIWSWGVVHHSSMTARIVRNVAHWLRDDGTFAGMVYHRDSTPVAVAIVRQWLLRGKLLTYSLDEACWRNTDGFSARFYPAEQWRDLLLGFFQESSVTVTGLDSELPVPRSLRKLVVTHLSYVRKQQFLSRFGGFIVFSASAPLQPSD
jgi:SAM-dependent methyltransferase